MTADQERTARAYVEACDALDAARMTEGECITSAYAKGRNPLKCSYVNRAHDEVGLASSAADAALAAFRCAWSTP